MNEIDPTLNPPEKSGAGRLSWILPGMALLVVALFLGVYFYGAETTRPQSEPEIKAPESLPSVPAERSDRANDESPGFSGEPLETLAETEDLEYVGEDLDPSHRKQALPALDESDGFARNRLAALSDRSEFARWIGIDHLIPKITMLIDNVSKGIIPAAHFREFAPKEKFSVIEKSPDQFVVDPEGYHRYDIYAAVADSIDVDAGFRSYQSLKPLFDAAYGELGYPDGDFDAVLRRAIEHLLETPVLSGEISLVRPSVMYRFADPDLESLSKAQKQMIRMGPRNTRIIQMAMRKFLDKLDRNVSDVGPGDSFE